MAKFLKISLWKMCAMAIVTFGFYPFAWIAETARQLRAAGGKVPSTYFYFSPILAVTVVLVIGLIVNGFDFAKSSALINSYPILTECFWIFIRTIQCYFWFGYVRSYCHIIRHKNDTKTIWTYFILTLLFEFSFIFLKFFKFPEHFMGIETADYDFIISLVRYVIGAILINAALFLLFQRGFNNYVEEHN